MTIPIGRFNYHSWPVGLHCQAITMPANSQKGAFMYIRRVDGQPFAIPEFTFQLLANTAATGANLEITPLLDGEDMYNDPVMFDASGYGKMNFHYSGMAQEYKLKLFVDFAIMQIKLTDL